MKRMIGIFCLSIVVFTSLAYSPVIDGAMADVKIKVINEKGDVVQGAAVSVTLYTSPENAAVKRGETDENGCFATKGNCIGEAQVWVRKSGYYNSKQIPEFRKLPFKDVEKGRRWSAEPVETVVILKKKHNPAQLVMRNMENLSPPATNVNLSLDLETLQWCAPYGNGCHNDICVKYESWDNPTNWFSFYRSLTIFSPNALDGFYMIKKDSFSEHPYPYEADGGTRFEKTLSFVFDRRSGSVTNKVLLAKDSGIVYRVRSVTNETGRIIRANYGRMDNIEIILGLTLQSWFNDKINDVNIEDPRK